MTEVALLLYRADKLVNEITDWAEQFDGRRSFFRPKQMDRLRLLRLQVWATRYYVPLSEVLSILVPIMRKETKAKSGIGVSITHLVGPKAYQILKDNLNRMYPDKSQVTAWREREQEVCLAREAAVEDGEEPKRSTIVTQREGEDPALFVKRYIKSTDRAREAYRKYQREEWRRRKPYRYNPFID